ncbi:MAG: neutral/alkaline non-lysosomal ceramidase N-terminal domain-containing protein [Pirellulaceae bacterium]
MNKLMGAICILFVSWLLAADLEQAWAGTLRAAVVKLDVTPETPQWLQGYGPRQSDGVHDKLYHRIVVLDDGTSRFFLISTDICSFSPGFHDRVIKELGERENIPPKQVWWSVTHTHSAPVTGPPGLVAIMLPERYEKGQMVQNPEFTARLKQTLFQGIRQAKASLKPARLGVGSGVAHANVNRRQEDADGNISLGVNPDRPVDRTVGVLRLERPDGSLLALIANYAMHGTALGSANTKISGDAPGGVAQYVEQQLGAPMLYINGAAGNIAPIHSVKPNFKEARITEFNHLLGDQIIEANQNIPSTTGDVKLKASREFVRTPRKAGFGWVPELDRFADATPSGDPLVKLPISCLQINDDIMIWAAPVELFCQIATNIRNESPFPHTFYFGYTNGFFGYLPIAEAFAEGGYEAGRVTPFTPRAESDLTQAVLAMFAEHSRS